MLSQGIILGLGLSLLVGPIVIALLEGSLTQGFRAGISVGAGIWVSDAIFISATYMGLAYIKDIIDRPGFFFVLGLVGGIVLIAFGVGAILSRPKVKVGRVTPVDPKPYWRWFVKGFLINTLNPFTVFFWSGVAGTIVGRPETTPTDAAYFYTGVFSTIVLSDSLKVGLAKLIRKKLTPVFVYRLQLVAGIALLVFGVVLIIRSAVVGG